MLVTCVLAIAVLQAQGTSPANAEADVRAAEAARIEATIANDFEALDRLLGDDLTYTHSNAQVDSKERFIAILRSGRTRYRAIEPSEVVVRLYGQAAILTGQAAVDVVTNGQPNRILLRFTSAWVQRAGRWQFVAWQSTRVP